MTHPRLLVLLVGALAFALALPNPFLDFDDGRVILGQPFLQDASLAGLWRCLSPFPFREEPLPLRDLTYWLNFTLHGPWAPGFVAINLLLHGATSLAVLSLGERVLARAELPAASARAAALAGALLFALHPIHAESVVWLSGRKDVLSGALYLLAACSWLDYLAAEGAARRRSYLTTLALFVLSLGAKASVVSLPLVLCAADLLLGPRRPLRERALAALPFVLLSAGFVKGYTWLLASYDQTLGAGSSVVERHPEPVWKALLFTDAAVVELYLRRLVLPLDQRVFTTEPYRLEASGPVLRALLVCAAAWAGTLWLCRRRPALGFLALWIPLTLAPFLNIVPTGILYAERYLYLPSVGLCLLAGVAAATLARRLAGARAHLALGLVLAALSLPASQRCSAWARAFRGPGSLWSRVLARDPDNYIALANLAKHYAEPDGPEARPRDAARAEQLYRRLLEVHPSPKAAYRFGLLLEELGRLDEALEAFRRAAGPKPGWRRAILGAARVLARRSFAGGDPADAGEAGWITALRLHDYVLETWPEQGAKAAMDRARPLELAGQREPARAAWRLYLERYGSQPGEERAAAAAREALARLGG